jgi:hypothetical protein
MYASHGSKIYAFACILSSAGSGLFRDGRGRIRPGEIEVPLIWAYLEGPGAVARQQDDPQRAARLFAATRSLLEASGSGWLHAYVPRAPHDDSALAGLRARTTEPAFERAQAYGRTLTITSVLRYALEDTRRMQASRSAQRRRTDRRGMSRLPPPCRHANA